MRPTAKKRQSKPASYLAAALVGSLFAISALFLLALLFALVLQKTSDPLTAVFPCALFISAASGFLSGIVGAAKTRSANPFLGALASGAMAFLLVLLLSLAVPASPDSALRRISPPALLLFSSALAGMAYSAKR